eukprot:6200530-Pleurochrysis_carterae.AAC.2
MPIGPCVARRARGLGGWCVRLGIAVLRLCMWQSRRRIRDSQFALRVTAVCLISARSLLGKLTPASLCALAVVPHVVHHDPSAPIFGATVVAVRPDVDVWFGRAH